MNHDISYLGFGIDDVAPENGWHCSHFFYSFDRMRLGELTSRESEAMSTEFIGLFAGSGVPKRLQLGLVSGHKADFSLMMMDPDPVVLEALHQRLMNSRIGTALNVTYSYVSISEISEYVQTTEQYGERLQREGADPSSSEYQTKLSRYSERLEKMNYQRLTPDFPKWPVSCFYPMNKWRIVGANWFSLPVSKRHELMSEHARSGIKFAGKVSQLITVGIGLDDWEWGVTLWATNPTHLKQIVYDMRFDEASAKYAEFGPFYTSYLASAEKILALCLPANH